MYIENILDADETPLWDNLVTVCGFSEVDFRNEFFDWNGREPTVREVWEFFIEVMMPELEHSVTVLKEILVDQEPEE